MLEDSRLPHYDFTEAELNEMGEVLLRADKITSDSKLHKLVIEHMKKKSERISKISDLRAKMANEEITPKKET